VELVMEPIQVSLNVPDDLCEALMCTALEGGIGYWCRPKNILRVSRPNHSAYCGFSAYDAESSEFLGDVTYATIRQGVQRILGGTVKVNKTITGSVLMEVQRWPDEGGVYADADVADAIVQAGLLNEIVYG
jgi:hypothetical protein